MTYSDGVAAVDAAGVVDGAVLRLSRWLRPRRIQSRNPRLSTCHGSLAVVTIMRDRKSMYSARHVRQRQFVRPSSVDVGVSSSIIASSLVR